MVYDITNPLSLENIPGLKNMLIEEVQSDNEIPIILAGAKSDLTRSVPYSAGEKMARDINAVGFIETSAKLATNVEKLFYMAAAQSKLHHSKQVKPKQKYVYF